ncbi:Fur-regulated basic protein FbpA [Anaerobacillus sp. MEB173]|uniref:Fur-regulated basic protein FbpA n=1 Tax=Anaerobacillus sp. MEB173 TaxID=3383345 RepID=UPI003F911818
MGHLRNALAREKDKLIGKLLSSHQFEEKDRESLEQFTLTELKEEVRWLQKGFGDHE